VLALAEQIELVEAKAIFQLMRLQYYTVISILIYEKAKSLGDLWGEQVLRFLPSHRA
jgi:hypothetical protein